MLIGPINSGAAVGGAGVATATGSSTQVITGLVYQVVIKYNDAPPAATTVVTIKTKGTAPAAPSSNILVVTNSATNASYQPRFDSHKTDATALVTNTGLPPVEDIIQVVIAGADAADNVDVWLYLL